MDEKFSDLRHRAQQKIVQRPASELSELSSGEIANLIEELLIHRAELEMQNEELRQAQQQLEMSRRQYLDLYDFAPIGYFTFDANGLILNVNVTGASQLEVTRSELIKQPFTDYISPTSQDTFYLHCRQVLETKAELSCELQLLTQNGSRFAAQLQSLAQVDESGDDHQIQSALLDISERKRTEKRIELLQTITQNVSEATSFHAALESTLNSIGQFTNWDYGEAWTLDEVEQVMKCTPVWYGSHESLGPFREQSEMLKFQKNVGIPGRVWASEQPEWLRDVSTVSESHFTRRPFALDVGLRAAVAVPFLANHRIVVVLVFFMFEARSENEGMVEILSAIAAQLGLVLHRKKVQDEREQLHAAVEMQREALRNLTARLAEVREEEQRHLAQELHDRIGQKLSALGFNLTFIQKQLALLNVEKSELQTRLADSLGLVEQTTDNIRNVMADLRPSILDEQGLGAALKWYADQFTRRTELKITMQSDILSQRLPQKIETSLFRIAQEALNNTAKHARATSVTITVGEEDHVVRLIVSDNGLGFDPIPDAASKNEDGWGLLIMQERARSVGGYFTVNSQPGRGTKIIVEVPR